MMNDLKSRIEALTPVQRERLAERLDQVAPSTVPVRLGSSSAMPGSATQLVAYVVSKQGAAVTEGQLKESLAQELPEYMVPAKIVFLEEFPTTTSGKIDKKRMSALDVQTASQGSTDKPLTPAEEILVRIWTEVLSVDEVRLDDNFYELGGDSLLSIRIIARARQAGLTITPEEFFADPTVAAIAAAASGASSDTHQTTTESSKSSFPLTPIQHWFFTRDFPDPHHWNQAALLAIPPGIDLATMQRIVDHLVRHHDALRLRFDNDGDTLQQSVSTGAVPVVSEIDLCALEPAKRDEELLRVATKFQESFDLGSGVLMNVALFRRGSDTDRLLVIVHHLAVDGLSWSMLLEQIYTAYTQLRDGKTISVPEAASFHNWVRKQQAYASSDELGREADHWLALETAPECRLPLDFPRGRESMSVAEQRRVSVCLEEGVTDQLLREVPNARRVQVNEVLITALARSLLRWSGGHHLRLDLEGHGRESVVGELDISSTLGWFTSLFTAHLELPLDSGPDDLKRVKEQLRAIPNGGIGQGLLRFMRGDPELSERMRGLPVPDVVFNYLGTVHASSTKTFPPASESIGPWRSARGTRPYLLEINAFVDSGRLTTEWTFSPGAHRADTVRRLMEDYSNELSSLVADCLADEGSGVAPSDFPLASVDQEELDRIAMLLDEGEE